MTQFSPQDRVLCIGAHPDDLVSTMGGTVARLVSLGVEVHYAITTNGDKGWTKNHNMTHAHLAQQREREQRAAARVLGVTNVVFLRYEDGRLADVVPSEVVRALVKVIRTVRPKAVFSWSPYYNFNEFQHGFEHTDHRTTGMRVLDAVYPAARDYMAFDELKELPGWTTSTVYLFRFKEGGHVVSLSESEMELKIKSLLQHKSQYSNATAVAQDVRATAMRIAKTSPACGAFCESFTIVPQL